MTSCNQFRAGQDEGCGGGRAGPGHSGRRPRAACRLTPACRLLCLETSRPVRPGLGTAVQAQPPDVASGRSSLRQAVPRELWTTRRGAARHRRAPSRGTRCRPGLPVRRWLSPSVGRVGGRGGSETMSGGLTEAVDVRPRAGRRPHGPGPRGAGRLAARGGGVRKGGGIGVAEVLGCSGRR
jgi:hypothetical protein